MTGDAGVLADTPDGKALTREVKVTNSVVFCTDSLSLRALTCFESKNSIQ